MNLSLLLPVAFLIARGIVSPVAGGLPALGAALVRVLALGAGKQVKQAGGTT